MTSLLGDGVSLALWRSTMQDAFSELCRYVRFGDAEGAALRNAYDVVEPHFGRISDDFYSRLNEHPDARQVFESDAQVARLQVSLRDWMRLIFTGPWDDAYYRKRARIGQIHVKIGLPQRYMFGAMNLIRVALIDVVSDAYKSDGAKRSTTVTAISKILDLELAIMLETYREAFVGRVQAVERLERQELERSLAVSRARYDEIVERGDALVVIFDEHGTLTFINRRCEAVLGRRRDQLDGASWAEVLVTPSQRDHALALIGKVWDGDPQPAVELGLGHGEEALRWIRWHFTTLPSESGKAICGLGLDVTEERDLQQRTRRAEHLAGLGTMAAGLAHEIRNPLNAAHLQLTLMQRRMARLVGSEIEVVRAAADLVGSEIKRLAALVEQFLHFARPQPLITKNIDLRRCSEKIVALLAPEAQSHGITLSLDDGAPVQAQVDEERIEQVLINLIRNAIEALSEDGHAHGPRITVGVDGDGLKSSLHVADNGPGLPRDDAPIFQPFYTTKRTGTGLGLSIVHRIALQHGGDISVDSRPGRTVFTLTLPRSTGALGAGDVA